MSYGLVICSECKCEVHQQPFTHDWIHCEDQSPRCEGAQSIYPTNRDEIQGEYCGADDLGEKK